MTFNMEKMAHLFIAIVFSLIFSEAAAFSEQDLVTNLLDAQTQSFPDARPVANRSEALTVNISVSIIEFLNINLEERSLDLLGWLHTEWHDNSLSWSVAEFGDVPIVLSADAVWTPDIMIFNTITPASPTHHTRLEVSHAGHVKQVIPWRGTLRCPEFDPESGEQRCIMTVGSWAYTAAQVDVLAKRDRLDATYYRYHPEWELHFSKAKARIRENSVPAAKEVAFTMVIRPVELHQQHDDTESLAPGNSVYTNFIMLLCAISIALTNLNLILK